MAGRQPPGRRRRLAAALLPPVGALLGAWAWTSWQAGRVEQEVSAFCASIAPGLALREFAALALERDFRVGDSGPGSRVLTAEKDVYALRHEFYACHAEHDGERVVRTRFEHRSE